MPGANRTYYISLGYDAYYCKTMAVEAENVSEACEFAMSHADEGAIWEDSLESSPHWIVSIDDDFDLVLRNIAKWRFVVAGLDQLPIVCIAR